MLVTNFLYKRLGEHARHCIANYNGEALPWGIVIVDEQTDPREDYLCIVDSAALDRIAHAPEPPRNTYLFLTEDATAGYESLASFKDVSIFETGLGTIALYNRLQDVLSSLGSVAFNRTSNGQDFGALINDVVEMQLVRREEIYEAMRFFPTFVDLSFRVLVFESDSPDDEARNASLLMSELPRIFPRSNAASYYGRVVAVVQPKDWATDDIELAPDKIAELQAVCEKTRCVVAVGNACLNWQVFRTQYLIGCSIANIGRHLRTDPATRVFTAEKYMAYVSIEWAFKEYMRQTGSDNYIYLINPGAAQLLRYDQENEGDLLYVLRGYLENECNASQAAEALNMHRNTVVYKMRKIESLLTVPLDDAYTRERLLWSCLVIEYCEKVQGIYPDSFKGYGNKNRHPIVPNSTK